ncbi:MAG: DNA/RNA non-specific endonuclease [Bacteroidales bacterium]
MIKRTLLLQFVLFVSAIIITQKSYSQPDVWCMPAWDCTAEITLRHQGYTVSYDIENKIPKWVAYYLVPHRLKKISKRSDDFRPDPWIPLAFSATLQDYKSSGYDRGHLAPAADMSWSDEVMSESFFLSNMTPQEPSFNRGIWKKLEDEVRKWAQTYDTLLIVTGPMPGAYKGYIGDGKVAVPVSFYKALMAWQNNVGHGLALVIPNEASNQPIAYYALSVDSLESLLSCNLFAALPQPAQENAECKIDWAFWHLQPREAKTSASGSGKKVRK